MAIWGIRLAVFGLAIMALGLNCELWIDKDEGTWPIRLSGAGLLLAMLAINIMVWSIFR